ncbi:MAG: glycosyltransferase family protein [Magnetococcales bacterium]|nr:glycosyltransferase family protein [Magnetococcales bacterium]
MILGILQARYSSRRLPGKVLLPILGRPMLACQLERLRRVRQMDRLVVATSDETSDDAIAALCRELAIPCYRGSLDDVLDRFYRAAIGFSPVPAQVVRLTGDCPLADPALIDRVIAHHLRGGFDYTSNIKPPTYPDGLDVEVMRFPVLAEAWREAQLPSQREHVTLFINGQPERFRLGNVTHDHDLSALRWTVDESEDLELVRKIYEALYPRNPEFAMAEVLALLAGHPEWQEGNRHHERNAGLALSLAREGG